MGRLHVSEPPQHAQRTGGAFINRSTKKVPRTTRKRPTSLTDQQTAEMVAAFNALPRWRAGSTARGDGIRALAESYDVHNNMPALAALRARELSHRAYGARFDMLPDDAIEVIYQALLDADAPTALLIIRTTCTAMADALPLDSNLVKAAKAALNKAAEEAAEAAIACKAAVDKHDAEMKALVGRDVRVWWDGDAKDYLGVVTRTNARSRVDGYRTGPPPRVVVEFDEPVGNPAKRLHWCHVCELELL